MADDISRTEVDNYRKNHLKAEEAYYISEHNEELIHEFYKAQQGNEDRSKRREKWYLGKWKMLLKRYISKDQNLDELTRTDWSQILDKLKEDEEKDYADSVVDNFKAAIRQFYKQRYPLAFNRPDRVKEILQSPALRNKKESKKELKRTRNILTPEQVWKLCDAARNPRDALIPIFCFDAGARTEEIHERTISDVDRHKEYWTVTFHDAKNGKDDRPLPLIHCQSKLQAWLEHHPQSDDPDAPLWVTLSDCGDGVRGKKMTKTNLNDVLKRLGKRADLEKIDPETLTVYDFRHSSATYRGTEKDWEAQKLKWWYSWKKTSRADTYCHDEGERMQKAILRDEGIEPTEEEISDTMQTKHCPRCKEKRSTDADYCPHCSLPLETETVLKDSALKEAGRRVVEMKLDEKVDDEKLQEIVAEVQEEG